MNTNEINCFILNRVVIVVPSPWITIVVESNREGRYIPGNLSCCGYLRRQLLFINCWFDVILNGILFSSKDSWLQSSKVAFSYTLVSFMFACFMRFNSWFSSRNNMTIWRRTKIVYSFWGKRKLREIERNNWTEEYHLHVAMRSTYLLHF